MEALGDAPQTGVSSDSEKFAVEDPTALDFDLCVWVFRECADRPTSRSTTMPTWSTSCEAWARGDLAAAHRGLPEREPAVTRLSGWWVGQGSWPNSRTMKARSHGIELAGIAQILGSGAANGVRITSARGHPLLAGGVSLRLPTACRAASAGVLWTHARTGGIALDVANANDPATSTTDVRGVGKSIDVAEPPSVGQRLIFAVLAWLAVRAFWRQHAPQSAAIARQVIRETRSDAEQLSAWKTYAPSARGWQVGRGRTRNAHRSFFAEHVLELLVVLV